MNEATLLESRVDKIERDNRRLKLTVGALLLALAAVPLIGAVMPEQIPDVVVARAFHAVNENGNIRARIAADGIAYFTELGDYGVGIRRAGITNNGISYFDENGDLRVAITNSGITYLDENDTLRARLGSVGLDTPSTGATTTYPAQVVLFDDDEKVIWQAVGR